MEKQQILSVAQTILSQLFTSITPDIIHSWGFRKPSATVFHEMPALAFRVDARLFKGVVLVALNGADLYELYLMTPDAERCLTHEAYDDQFADILDVAIERGDNEEEYAQFCKNQLHNLVSDTVVII